MVDRYLHGDHSDALIDPHTADAGINQITTWKAQLESVAADVFGPGGGGSPLPTVAVKTLHAKIGQLTVERDFLARRSGR
jgi:hypothetical protein